MKNMLKKAGFISIEFMIIAGVVLLVGVFAVSKFASTGSGASKEANTAIEGALEKAKNEAKDEAKDPAHGA